MGEAFGLGAVAASSLLLGALVALAVPVTRRPLGMVMAFGSGVLISSVAYELVEEAFKTSAGPGELGLGLMAGALTFFFGDVVVDRLGGADRKDATGLQASGSALAIVLGTVLDGIPESVVLGVGLVSGTTGSLAMFVAVFLSNLPEAMVSTAGLRTAGWPGRRLLGMWGGIVAASGVAAAVGFTVFDRASPAALAFVLAYAGGAILTMLADSMMPGAFEHGGNVAGVVTTVGFGAGFLLAKAG